MTNNFFDVEKDVEEYMIQIEIELINLLTQNLAQIKPKETVDSAESLVDAFLNLSQFPEQKKMKLVNGSKYAPRNQGACPDHRRLHMKCKLDCPGRDSSAPPSKPGRKRKAIEI